MRYEYGLWNLSGGWRVSAVIALSLASLALLSAQLYRGPGGEIGETAARKEYEAITSQVGIEQKLGTQLPLELTFKDETGKTVRLGDYFGKRPVILVLAYYECPMLCTVVLNELTRAMNGLDLYIGKDFEVVTVSISPTETPELAAKKKANYAKAYKYEGAEKGWHFLVGEEQQYQAAGGRRRIQVCVRPEDEAVRARRRHHDCHARRQALALPDWRGLRAARFEVRARRIVAGQNRQPRAERGDVLLPVRPVHRALRVGHLARCAGGGYHYCAEFGDPDWRRTVAGTPPQAENR
jgi:cytochrome oxidase Cu insertion factor (SCO1/SenC/PrrC family)